MTLLLKLKIKPRLFAVIKAAVSKYRLGEEKKNVLLEEFLPTSLGFLLFILWLHKWSKQLNIHPILETGARFCTLVFRLTRDVEIQKYQKKTPKTPNPLSSLHPHSHSFLPIFLKSLLYDHHKMSIN